MFDDAVDPIVGDDYGFMGNEFVPPAMARPMRMGVNLREIRPWTSNHPFLNLMTNSHDWETYRADTLERTGFRDDIVTTKTDWPTAVPFTPAGEAQAQVIGTFTRVPEAAVYTLAAEGTGKVQFSIAGQTVMLEPEGSQVTADIDLTGLNTSYRNPPDMEIRVLASDAVDNLRNIAIVRKARFNNYKRDLFSDLYIRRLAPFKDLRFMDWMETNGNRQIEWTDRPTPMGRQQSRKGIALEHIINLCNRVKANCWVNVPLRASDDYITKMAELFRDNLDPELKVIAEYSNETWAFIGKDPNGWQRSFLNQVTLPDGTSFYDALPADANDWQKLQAVGAYRQVRVWEIFKEVFGDAFDARSPTIMGGQFRSTGVTNERLKVVDSDVFNPQGIALDGYGFAPYFGLFYKGEDYPRWTALRRENARRCGI